jgi:hypothetical protein
MLQRSANFTDLECGLRQDREITHEVSAGFADIM